MRCRRSSSCFGLVALVAGGAVASVPACGKSEPDQGGGGGAPAGGGAGGSPAGAGGSPAGAGGSPSGCVPDYGCKPVAPDTGDIYADCVARVNQFRACVCLPPLVRWTAGEACANQDAQYDSQQNSAHAGFEANICAAGNAQDECPGWSGATAASVIDQCLQMMFGEGPPPGATCSGQCYSDHGHYINMTGTRYRSGVACGFFTTAGGALWAVQNFQ